MGVSRAFQESLKSDSIVSHGCFKGTIHDVSVKSKFTFEWEAHRVGQKLRPKKIKITISLCLTN